MELPLFALNPGLKTDQIIVVLVFMIISFFAIITGVSKKRLGIYRFIRNAVTLLKTSDFDRLKNKVI